MFNTVNKLKILFKLYNFRFYQLCVEFIMMISGLPLPLILDFRLFILDLGHCQKY